MINYTSAMEVKQINPRPVNTLSILKLAPSLLYKYSNTSRLGFAYMYSLKREDIETRRSGLQQKTLFLFTGMGFYSKQNMLAYFNRLYKTDNHVFELSYQYDDKKWMSLSSINYEIENTIIEDGKQIIKSDYSFHSHKFSLNSLLSLKQESSLHALDLSFSFREDIGIRNILNKEYSSADYYWKKYGENQEHYRKSIFAKIEYKLKMSSWKNNIALVFTSDSEEHEYFPSRFYRDYKNLLMKYYISKSIHFSKYVLSLSANVQYRQNMYEDSFLLTEDNIATYNIDSIDEQLIDEISRTDFSYDTANYLSTSFLVKCEIPLLIYNKRTNTYLSFEYTKISAKDLGQRESFAFALGLNI
jgi:hypothetical protein